MERKNFNITLDLLVDETMKYADTKLQIYWNAYELAIKAEKKAREKEKRLAKEMYKASDENGAYEAAEAKWKKAMREAVIARELRRLAWTACYQGSAQLREESNVGEN